MSYFAESAWSYVERKVAAVRAAGGSRRLLITLPTLPEGATLALAETFKSHCIAEGVDLTFKVAESVWREWSTAGRQAATAKGWLDEEGSLTRWRHEMPVGNRTTLVVLAGADTVTDAGGLADFHRCDADAVWREQMRSSFRSWIRMKLVALGVTDDRTDARDFDRLLVPLMEHGRADLLGIGDWLEAASIDGASSVRDVQRSLLGTLSPFKLPNLSGFPFNKARASLGRYIEKATGFFSYTIFLEAREREKALRAIAAIETAMDDEDDINVLLEGDTIGAYPDAKAFLQGLRNYVEDENAEDRTRLIACDFVVIIDKVLKFRRAAEPRPPKDPLRRARRQPGGSRPSRPLADTARMGSRQALH